MWLCHIALPLLSLLSQRQKEKEEISLNDATSGKRVVPLPLSDPCCFGVCLRQVYLIVSHLPLRTRPDACLPTTYFVIVFGRRVLYQKFTFKAVFFFYFYTYRSLRRESEGIFLECIFALTRVFSMINSTADFAAAFESFRSRIPRLCYCLCYLSFEKDQIFVLFFNKLSLIKKLIIELSWIRLSRKW